MDIEHRLSNVIIDSMQCISTQINQLTKYYMDFAIYRYRLHLQIAQHVVIDLNVLSLAAIVVLGNILFGCCRSKYIFNGCVMLCCVRVYWYGMC